MFYAAYEDGGRVDGYVTYRITGTTLVVNELMAATSEANAALWRFCFDVDLISTTEARKRPLDDPMPVDVSRSAAFTEIDKGWIVAASGRCRCFPKAPELYVQRPFGIGGTGRPMPLE